MLITQPYCGLLTGQNEWRSIDYDARFYALAVKGEYFRLKGSYDFNGQTLRGEPAATVTLRQHYGRWAARQLKTWGYKNPIIIPVPNSNVTLTSGGNFETAKIARAVATAFGPEATVSTILRFAQVQDAAHKNKGRRTPERFLANMVVSNGAPIKEVVLLDDVVTSGSHIQAAKMKLAGQTKASPIRHALVCGQASSIRLDDPFKVSETDWEDPFAGW